MASNVIRTFANTIAILAMVFVFCLGVPGFQRDSSAATFCGPSVATLPSGAEAEFSDIIIESIESGLDGSWRVGYTTQHRVTLKASRECSLLLEVQTVDGDGVSVTYADSSWGIDLGIDQVGTVVVYAKHGRPDRPITIRITDRGTGLLIDSRQLNESERGVPLPSEQPWLVGVGSNEMGLDVVTTRSIRAGLADYSTTILSEADGLPILSKAWDGVDLLVLSSHNIRLLEQLTEGQARAIREWIQREGGRCVLALGVNAERWFANPHFAALVPGGLRGVDARSSPGPLESYLNSESRLDELGSALLKLEDVAVDLEGQSSDRSRYPLIARWASGLGKVKFFAGELESSPIQGWAGRPLLIKLIIGDQWAPKSVSGTNVSEDLSVQLHGSLDRFSKLIIGNLTQMTAIVFALLLLVGPLDYWLVVKKWKSPRATWITILLSSVGCCGLLVWLQNSWKPKVPSINQAEVVEWDMVTKSVHGRVFAHMYGGNRGLYDVSWQPTEKSLLASLQQNSLVSGEKQSYDSRIDWFGMPGRSIGGFQSTIGTDRMLPSYKIEKTEASDTRIRQLAIPEAGTKALLGAWSAPIGDVPASDLKTISGAIDLLTGTVVNPLPYDLLSGMIFYRGRFYSLPTRFVAGESIDLTVSNIPKDIARRLQRRISVDGKDKGTPWKSGDLTDIKRIFEVVLFHKAAGAGAYTIGQENRYLSWLDQSDLLKADRAILFGELENRQVSWNLERNGSPVELDDGQTVSFVRVVLPVTKGSSSLILSTDPSTSAF